MEYELTDRYEKLGFLSEFFGNDFSRIISKLCPFEYFRLDPNGNMGAMTGYFANLLILWFSFHYSFDSTQVPTCLMCRQEE